MKSLKIIRIRRSSKIAENKQDHHAKSIILRITIANKIEILI